MVRRRLPRILCVGVDITWWGGSRRQPSSRFETIVSATIDEPAECTIRRVPLSGALNPRWHLRTEPNYDADGTVLCSAIIDVLEQHGEVDHVVLSLDAPLECRHQDGQPARRKAVGKGEQMGSLARNAELELRRYVQSLDTEGNGWWRRDLRIQAGSPIPPRIDRVVELLRRSSSADLRPYRAGSAPTPRGVVEVFPSEAIWALGLLGCYGDQSSSTVRSYKRRLPRRIGVEAARSIARRPLEGFLPLLAEGGIDHEIVSRWIDQIVAESLERSRTGDGDVRQSKAFDDPIDSGIAFLTSVACAVGLFHEWGDGRDGTIVGPGKLPR